MSDHGSRTMDHESRPIRVMIVDDHGMVRKGLAAYLLNEDDLELVGEASNGREALHLCAEVRPYVVLIDVVMPDMDGIAATRAIRQNYPEVRVIVLTNFGDEEIVRAARSARPPLGST